MKTENTAAPQECHVRITDDGEVRIICDLRRLTVKARLELIFRVAHLERIFRLEREVPGFRDSFREGLSHSPANPRAYLKASKAAVEAIVASEQSDVQAEAIGRPDVMSAMPALARLLVNMSRRPEGGAN